MRSDGLVKRSTAPAQPHTTKTPTVVTVSCIAAVVGLQMSQTKPKHARKLHRQQHEQHQHYTTPVATNLTQTATYKPSLPLPQRLHGDCWTSFKYPCSACCLGSVCCGCMPLPLCTLQAAPRCHPTASCTQSTCRTCTLPLLVASGGHHP